MGDVNDMFELLNLGWGEVARGSKSMIKPIQTGIEFTYKVINSPHIY